jgi:O-antigen ligase
MPPLIALLLWLVLLIGLFYFDTAKTAKLSVALWVPEIWVFFMASRQPTQWLEGKINDSSAVMAKALQDGDPLNRAVSLALLLLGIAILGFRRFGWGKFFSRNRALTGYLVFALVSVLWSDLPSVAFRKWFRDLGNYVMVLVVLSDPRPVEAIGVLLRRLGYLLIPLSIVLIKYFPDWARQYDPYTGFASYTGAATSKNMLGELCLVCGIYFIWDTVVRWPDRKNRRQKRLIVINASMIGMVVWLLNICDSATSRTCLILASLVILAAHSKAVQRSPAKLTVTVPVVFLVYMFLFFGLGLGNDFAAAAGRTSLSGRPEIWHIVLSQHTNPLLGAGYESFWMGPRLERIWESGMGRIIEAHNGYLETYLNLGYVGLFLVLVFVAATYRNICRRFTPSSNIASLALAIWTAFLFHCCTEADFRCGLMWFVFVMAAVAVSWVAREKVREAMALHGSLTRQRVRPLVPGHVPGEAIAKFFR